jgi:hypothetical protein
MTAIIKQWTLDNKIAVAGIIIITLVGLGSIGNHLSAFGGMEVKVKDLSLKSTSYEQRIDRQEVQMVTVITKLDLILKAWNIPIPKKEGE